MPVKHYTGTRTSVAHMNLANCSSFTYIHSRLAACELTTRDKNLYLHEANDVYAGLNFHMAQARFRFGSPNVPVMLFSEDYQKESSNSIEALTSRSWYSWNGVGPCHAAAGRPLHIHRHIWARE